MISTTSLIEFIKISPTPSLVVQPDAPKFTITAVNNAYLEATNTHRKDFVGKGILDAFSANKNNPNPEDLEHLMASLNTVVKTKKRHTMATQKNKTPIPGTAEFEFNGWNLENNPLLNDAGEIALIILSLTALAEPLLAAEKVEKSKILMAKGNDILQQTESIAKLARWELDFASKKAYWSDNHYTILGFEPQEFEVTFDKTLSFVHPDDKERFQTHFESTLKEKKDFVIEFRFITKQKSVLHIINRGSFIFDTQGNIKKLIGIIQDITDISIAESNALQAKEALQKILDLSLDIICTSNETGYFLTINSACETILGYTQEEMIGKIFSDFVNQDDYTKSIEAQKEIVAGIEVTTFENTFIHKNGNLVSILWSARYDETEKKMYGVGKNITSLNEAKKDAKEKQDFIEIALESLPIGVTLHKADENLKVLWMNSKSTEIYGWSKEVMSQFPEYLTKIFPNEKYRNELTNSILKDVRTGDKEKMNWKNIIITTQTGEQKIINALSIPIPEQNLLVSTVMDVTEQMNAQKIIEESIERYEYVTKATSDAVWDWDLITDTIYYGEGFERLFGHKIDTLEKSSASWKSRIHPDDNERVLENIYSVINGKENKWMAEYRYKKSNGDYTFVNDKGVIIRDAQGKATRIVGAMQDITKQKEEASRLMLVETVITNTTDAVVIKEANPSSELGRKIIYVNDAFTRMSGYAASEIIGKTHKVLHGPHTDTKELERFYKALDEIKPINITILNYKKNGQEFWVNLVLNPVFNNNGEHTHWISIERDVTEKKTQEQKLLEVSEKLFFTLESIQDGFYTLDNDWNVSYWNSMVEEISGVTQNEMIGKNIWDVFAGNYSKIMYAKFHEAKEKNIPIRMEVFSKLKRNWFEINAFPSNLGLTVYFKNIKERKKQESALKKMNAVLEAHIKELDISNQELEQFAYVASHDLQEPLRMVTGFLTQIEKKYEAVLDEKGKKYIFFAVDGAKRMRQIILDLLEFSRVGKISDAFEEVKLNDILEEIVLLYGAQIKEKGATLIYENLPKILSYSTPIKQIFQNIISNSLKYSKPNVPLVIKITSCHTAHEWKFAIQDNGIGIEAEYFNKIFILFQRLHNKEDYSGTGIGLAITKKIVENLGGQIWVESKVGIGTTFHFTIAKKTKKKL